MYHATLSPKMTVESLKIGPAFSATRYVVLGPFTMLTSEGDWATVAVPKAKYPTPQLDLLETSQKTEKGRLLLTIWPS